MQFCLRFIVSIALLLGCGKNDNTERLQNVRQGSNMVETGTLQAVRYRSVAVPWAHYDYGMLQVSFFEKEGTIVQKGQVIARIEASGVLKVLNAKKPELAIAEAELNKLKVSHETILKKLDADLRSARSTLQLAYIDTQRVAYESSAKKEIARRELLKAEISLHKIQQKIESTHHVQEEELKIQLARISQINSAIETALRTLEQFTILAPSEGMIEYLQNFRTRQKVKVGDQLYYGYPLIGLPDLRQIKILTSVNEVDIRKVTNGQKAVVRLDAFPKLPFDGVITTISQICHLKEEGKKIKVFDVEVLLNQTHRILKPGMTVSCEFLIPEQEKTVLQ